MPTVTRFAPSPTGPLHLGGARTALFNYLHAQINNGQFKLRIEDTDKNRSTQESTETIIESLNWLGLKINGEIIYQSKNIKEHIEIANMLLSKGLAYKCYHDQEYLNKFKLSSEKFISEWRNNQSNLPRNKPFCIRIKSPTNGKYVLNDKIQGDVVVKNDEIDDYIIVRSNGLPTFLLSSAIDDFNMKVTDIIRGDDHLTNSFRQKIIFDFLNYKPTFSHISLIHNEKNEKMSKRDNSPSILEYRNEGYLSEAINNYLVRLGWSYGDEEFFTINKLKRIFRINKIGKSPARFDEKKLKFLNNHYLKSKNSQDILKIINDLYSNKLKIHSLNQDNQSELIDLYKERAESLKEVNSNINNILKIEFDYSNEDKLIIKKFEKYKESLLKEFSVILKWTELNIEKKIKQIVDLNDLSFKEVAQPLRLLITGNLFGPSIAKVMKILGYKETIHRINRF
jgi:glutamyl-tRNA synthetase